MTRLELSEGFARVAGGGDDSGISRTVLLLPTPEVCQACGRTV
jgi:hypothetical protein